MRALFLMVFVSTLTMCISWNPQQDRATAYWQKVQENEKGFEIIVDCFRKDSSLEQVLLFDDGTLEINCPGCHFNLRTPSLQWHVICGKKVIVENELSQKYFEQWPDHRAMVEQFLSLDILKLYRADLWELLFIDIGLGQKSVFGLIYDLGSKPKLKSQLNDGGFFVFTTIPLKDGWYYYSD